MSSKRTSNGMLNSHQHHGKQHDDVGLHSALNKQSQQNKNTTTNGNMNSNGTNANQQSSNVLNVAEMLLHGVADNEILDIWLRSITCQEFANNFLEAGYDMPTISRITPQDLTAIGITDPAKRLKILSEIKKLNLQDGLPKFKPANLNHWLSLLRLDSQYHKSLCDQQIDTIEKTCQLTWEDLEELGITKLGHQKRLLLAIERMKELDSQENDIMSKPMSEPIYDTNPSQILLVASAENHSMNGPIINKQSSTSELSSTGSGSMHSLYSSNSVQYQPTYATLPSAHQQLDHQLNNSPQQQLQKQAIYSQPPSQMMLPPQHHITQTPQHQLSNGPMFSKQQQQQTNQHLNNTPQHQNTSHYQSIQPHFINPIYDTNNLNGRSNMMNRQSLGQLPFNALANLPKHQQQILQQSSIYATLSRQPQRVKQPPPPVPIRTNSLKSNSLVDEEGTNQQQMASTNNSHSSTLSLAGTQTNSANGLFRSGTRVTNRNQYNSQTLIGKNKSFSGGAYMDAARARFLNRNNQQQQFSNLPHPMQQQQQHMTNHSNGVMNNNQNATQSLIYCNNTTNMIRRDNNLTNGQASLDGDNLSLYARHPLPPALPTNALNLRPSDAPPPPMFQQINQRHSIQATGQAQPGNTIHKMISGDEYDRISDTNSTKSLILPTSNVSSSPINSNGQTSSSQDSGSSQTLYNSASSGSNDQNMNAFSQSRQSTVSNSTLNDVNLILDQQVVGQQQLQRVNNHDQQARFTTKMPSSATGRKECIATTGKDDDFPPPPSPLSLSEFDEHLSYIVAG